MSAAVSLPCPAEDDPRARMLRQTQAVLAGLVLCPSCMAPGPHPSNGAERLADLTFACAECGEWFELE